MNRIINFYKDINFTIFFALLFLFLIPFTIFIGIKHVAVILANLAYGFLVLSLLLGIRERLNDKTINKKRIKIFNILLILFILFLIFHFSTRFLSQIYEIKAHERRVVKASIYLEKGQSFLENQNYDNAIKEFEHAIKIDDDNYKSHYLIGRAFYKKGEYESAKNFLLHAVGLRSDDFSSNILLAVVFENLGDYDKAIIQYKIAKDLRLGDFGVHYGLGRTYYKVGKIYNALGELLIADKKNSGNFEVNFILGKIYYEKGDFKNSLKYFKFCETKNPDDKNVQGYISYLKNYD